MKLDARLQVLEMFSDVINFNDAWLEQLFTPQGRKPLRWVKFDKGNIKIVNTVQ